MAWHVRCSAEHAGTPCRHDRKRVGPRRPTPTSAGCKPIMIVGGFCMRSARLALWTVVAVLAAGLLGTPAHALICGDGVLDALEQCDDGNVVDGDCWSSTCQYEALGGSCDDADACTQTDACDGAGVCVGSNPVVCTALDQ